MSKKTKQNTTARYDEATVAKIATFLRSNSNQAAKEKFGCSAHWAGRLRDAKKIPPHAAPAEKTATKGGKKRKVGKRAAALL